MKICPTIITSAIIKIIMFSDHGLNLRLEFGGSRLLLFLLFSFLHFLWRKFSRGEEGEVVGVL